MGETMVGRSTKSAAESAEKPAIIFGRTPARKASPLTSSSAKPVRLVLDTNVVLDWLVFHDPASRRLEHMIGAGDVCWIACEPMRQELEHVLTRGALDAWKPDVPVILATWDRWTTHLVPAAPGARPRLHCTDPDDQVFIDLALHAGAHALLSRDRALLKLASAARPFGLRILTPSAWNLGAGELGQ